MTYQLTLFSTPSLPNTLFWSATSKASSHSIKDFWPFTWFYPAFGKPKKKERKILVCRIFIYGFTGPKRINNCNFLSKSTLTACVIVVCMLEMLQTLAVNCSQSGFRALRIRFSWSAFLSPLEHSSSSLEVYVYYKDFIHMEMRVGVGFCLYHMICNTVLGIIFSWSKYLLKLHSKELSKKWYSQLKWISRLPFLAH